MRFGLYFVSIFFAFSSLIYGTASSWADQKEKRYLFKMPFYKIQYENSDYNYYDDDDDVDENVEKADSSDPSNEKSIINHYQGPSGNMHYLIARLR